MQLKELCVLDVACCKKGTSVAEAARLMRQHHTGDLIVTDDSDGTREPVGIVTDRDIVMEVVAKGQDPDRLQVGQIMAKPIVVASGSEDIATAIERMRTHGVRRLPIVDDNDAVLGIVTLDDLYRVLADQTAALAAIVSKEQTRENRHRR
ncbi:CBS domain-containing protein [Peristeroidobacter soli]|jgi:CBS domain-containing protein|uniref:CBS domain-containing protein n=1 Tax=Peristeroidobacter soli TaxID=2497877 RepID=UPI00101BA929|nr:CBS domain-containing protein [Peristeroidobacter soli]